MPVPRDDLATARARRLLLLTAGSRGDLEPFVALAREASGRGHEVVLGATSSMTAELGAQPFRVVVLDGDLGGLVADQGVSPVAALRSWRSTVHPASVVPTRSDSSSRKGLRQVVDRFAAARELNPDLELLEGAPLSTQAQILSTK